jgi:prepilin peptidase CpaA
MTGTAIFVGAVALYMAAAAATDWRLRRIPNWLTVPTALCGLAYHTFWPHGWGPLASLGGFALGFAILLLPWLLGGGGMGDVKLLAALGAWLGPLLTLVAFALGGCLATAWILVALTYSALTKGIGKTGRRFRGALRPSSPKRLKRSPRGVPFAVPMALGTWLLLAWLVTRG